MSRKREKNVAAKVVGIVGAWITLPILGWLMLWFTAIVGQAVTNSTDYMDRNYAGYIILTGIIGLLMLSIILLGTWRLRKKSYFFHLNIGLWIGLGLYALILTGGLVVYGLKDTQVSQASCTTPLDQYNRSGSAIVPIATDLGVGTGFIIDDKGTILTAYHVIEGSSEQYANYASGRVDLTIVDQAPEYDLALLRLARYDQGFFSLSGNYNVGSQVYAYGYPSNAYTAGAPTVTSGIVSRKLDTEDLRMTNPETPTGFDLIQTDAPINPGNSGGPLLGSCGVIGVILAVSDSAELSDYVGAVSEQGIGYAVSINTAAQRFKLQLVSDQ